MNRIPKIVSATAVGPTLLAVTAVLFAMALPAARAATYCVATNGAPSPPYGTWTNAFTNIQEALNAAVSNDYLYLAGQTFILTNQLSWTGVASFVTIRGGYAATNTDAGIRGQALNNE